MNQQKTGKFIAALRHEKSLTQEQLGERLDVTNKTISRWENGSYMPDIGKLQSLSAELGVSINELLSGERICDNDFRRKADENLVAVLDNKAFNLFEKIAFWKKKWLKDHIALIVLCTVLWTAALAWCVFLGSAATGVGIAVGGILLYCILRNRMMIYVEAHAFDPPERSDTK